MPMKTLKMEQAPAKAKKSMALFPVRVSTMDAELQGFELPKKSYGRDLFDLVCRTIGLRETWYFGLQYVDSEGIPLWLRLDKKILDQDVPKEVPLNFTFLVKFYPEDVSTELIQEITQHLFYLQVKQSILNMDIYCPPEAAVLLASYAAQAELEEDYDENKFNASNLRMEDLLPQRVMDQFQMTPEMWSDKIKYWYSDHIDKSREEAEMEYLKIVQDLHMYGISYFQITNNVKKSDLWLGVDSRGLNVYSENDKLSPQVSFPWSEIKNISFKDKKFTIKLVKKKDPNFIFIAPKLKINKIILDLCVGNHELFMRRRKPDTMEIQAMKERAKELKLRKDEERKRTIRDKKLREEALREKEDMERKLGQLQEDYLATQEALFRSEKTSDLLADKAKLVEEEVMLLRQKAEKAENELQHMKILAMKTEEEKGQMERRARELEVITIKIMEECSRRTRESEVLKEELTKAKIAERAERERQLELARSSHSIQTMAFERDLSNELSDMMVSELVMDAEVGADTSDMGQLSLEIEKERMEYMEKSKSLHAHLKELKSEIEGMKVEENQSHYDHLHEEKLNSGDNKYSTLLKVKSGTTKARVAFFEEL